MSRELSSRPSRILFWSAAVVVGLIQVWAHRHNINPDSISYIEIAQSAREAGWKVAVSARSGETEDNWLADLAVGWSGDFIKVGSITQSERLAKYNRLLMIEDTHAVT